MLYKIFLVIAFRFIIFWITPTGFTSYLGRYDYSLPFTIFTTKVR